MKEILHKFKKNPIFWLLPIFLFFLLVNMFFSQKISPVFYSLVNNDKKSAVLFLQKIRNHKDFDKQLKYFEGSFGPSLENDVFAKELQKEAKIKQLEQVLDKNLQSRDVLYSLYLLNLEKGDKTSAEKYLRLAKEVDPNIK